MTQFRQIATINNLSLSPAAQNEVQTFSQEKIIYYSDDSQSEAETISRIGTADAVLGSWNSTITKKVLDACPNLKYIGICGTSLTNIDVAEVTQRGITLNNVADYGDEATAEFIFAELLTLYRGFGKYQINSLPSELNGKVIGIVGLGAVGKQIARLALGFNMKVVYFSRTRNPDWENRGLVYQDLDSLLSQSDIITLSLPRNLNLIGQREFSLIKPKAVLVNISLGNVFDLPSFVSWINQGQNYFIVDKQDYLEVIKDLPHVISLPFTAGYTQESLDRLAQKVILNLKSAAVHQ